VFDNIREDLAHLAHLYYGKSTLKHKLKAMTEEPFPPVLLFRMADCFYHNHLGLIGYFFRMLNQVLFGIVIGPKANIGPGLIISHANGVVVNSHAKIGSHLIIQHQVTIGQSNLGIPTVGDYVYCGCGCKILGKITVGDNVKIGANAVVTKDVPSMCTVAGIPAKIIRRHEAPEEAEQQQVR
jgi:serine O-acetyltransferase